MPQLCHILSFLVMPVEVDPLGFLLLFKLSFKPLNLIEKQNNLANIRVEWFGEKIVLQSVYSEVYNALVYSNVTYCFLMDEACKTKLQLLSKLQLL